MPKKYAKKKRTTKSKKYNVKRKVQRKNVVPRTMVTLGTGLPKKIMCKHKYQETVSITIPIGVVIQRYIFSANGMYDPNITGTGHQPLYFDQLSALYDHYCVIGSKIRVLFPPPIDSNLNVGILIDDDGGFPYASSDTVAEQTQATRALVVPTLTRPTYLSRKWSAKKFFGGSILANTELQGNTVANPAEQSYFGIFFQSQSTPTAAYTYNFIVEIEYLAIWKELKDIASS